MNDFVHMDVLVIASFISILSSHINGEINHCWCSSLHQNIRETREAMIQKYGLERLRASSVLSSSGTHSGFVQRILHCIRRKKPLRVAILGGSHTMAEPVDRNPWITNVTRWLDFVLSSASNCLDPDRRSIKYVFLNHSIPCRSDSEKRISVGALCADTPLTNISTKPVLFCGRFEDPEEGAKYHSRSRPLHEICDQDEELRFQKKCVVYRGSGASATIVHAGKGNRGTQAGDYSIIHNANMFSCNYQSIIIRLILSIQ